MTVISTEDGIRVGDYGNVFSSTIRDDDGNPVDLTDATSVVMRFRSPDGVGIDKAMTVDDPTGGGAFYVIESGLFSLSGRWFIQVMTIFADSAFSSNPESFMVYDVLPAP